jgi:hypothetical protein
VIPYTVALTVDNEEEEYAARLVLWLVGLLAAAGPARRGLRVDPTEALRDG